MTLNGNDVSAPRPVPDLAPVSVPSVVTDEDRNRYGVLLDHAAERGLLSPADYQVRLSGLAEGTSVEELQRIVTELPGLGGVPVSPGSTSVAPVPARPAPGSGSRGTTAPELDAALWAGLTPAKERRHRGNPWVILGILVAVLCVALVCLALVAGHVAHNHPAPVPASGLGAGGLSLLRL